jgi:hypothetical protein
MGIQASENALYIQIWTALIAMLLIKYLQFKSKFGWSLSNLVAFLRWNLFTYRDLWEWIDHPFNVLPLQPKPVQHVLSLPGFGQHLLRATTWTVKGPFWTPNLLKTQWLSKESRFILDSNESVCRVRSYPIQGFVVESPNLPSSTIDLRYWSALSSE